MKMSEAIFIFERTGGDNSPALTFDELDRYELYSYLLGFPYVETNDEQTKYAELKLKSKMIEYKKDIERANKFIELLDLGLNESSEIEIEGVNTVLKYLTELTLILAKIGITQDVSVYEAHRLYALNYKTQIEAKEE